MNELFFFQAEKDGLIHAHGRHEEYQYTIKWQPATNLWAAFNGDRGICMGELESCINACKRDADKPIPVADDGDIPF